jgi:hypothetical protein
MVWTRQFEASIELLLVLSDEFGTNPNDSIHAITKKLLIVTPLLDLFDNPAGFGTVAFIKIKNCSVLFVVCTENKC